MGTELNSIKDDIVIVNNNLSTKSNIKRTSWGTSLVIPFTLGVHGIIVVANQAHLYTLWTAGSSTAPDVHLTHVVGETDILVLESDFEAGTITISTVSGSNSAITFIGSI